MTDVLLTRWGSPHLSRARSSCSSQPWLGNGSVARWLSAGNGAQSVGSHAGRMCDMRVKRGSSRPWCGNGGGGRRRLGDLGHLGRSHVRVKCLGSSHPWGGNGGGRLGVGNGARNVEGDCECLGGGLGHVRGGRNLGRVCEGLRVKWCCCSSSSQPWQKARVGGGGIARRLGIGRGGLDGERSSCAWREQRLDVGLGHLGQSRVRACDLGEVCVKSFSGREFGSRRGVRARAFDEPRSWFRNFLFQSIDTSDFDMDSDVGEDLEEPESDEPESDEDGMEFEPGVEFEPRADGDGDEGGDGDADADAVSGAGDEVDQLLEDDRRFFRWKMKNEARNEVRDFQASGRDPDSQDWEDWLDDSWNQYEDNLAGGEDGWYEASPNWDKDGVPREPPSKPERGMKRTIKELFFRIFEPEDEVLEDLQFEERVFRFTSRTTAKFVGVLVVVPLVTDFVIHDFVMVPFLETYVEKVPLAAKVLDIRESQKLKIIETLKLERQRLRFEAEIGKAPPLSDDELSEHIREEALELREEYRLENRQAFASIWSDFAAGLTILLLLIFNPQKVAIMRLTGERLFTNISDTGKAFIIILLTDIFLGYHSESGWETVSEMVLEHYGIEVSQAAIYIFVAIVPVTIDACFKLWVFRFFRTLSPSASATFREMQRH